MASTTDWKPRTGGRSASRCALFSRTSCCRSAFVTSQDSRAALTGNELYLKGLYSGSIPSHAAFAKAGKIAGNPARPAKRAEPEMPIIGEISSSRSGLASCLSSMASSVYFIASAAPLE